MCFNPSNCQIFFGGEGRNLFPLWVSKKRKVLQSGKLLKNPKSWRWKISFPPFLGWYKSSKEIVCVCVCSITARCLFWRMSLEVSKWFVTGFLTTHFQMDSPFSKMSCDILLYYLRSRTAVTFSLQEVMRCAKNGKPKAPDISLYEQKTSDTPNKTFDILTSQRFHQMEGRFLLLIVF